MAKITWLGEDEPECPGPSFAIAYNGIKFPKGIPAEVSDNSMIEGARQNKFFKVEGPDEFVSLHAEPKRRGRPPKVKENV